MCRSVAMLVRLSRFSAVFLLFSEILRVLPCSTRFGVMFAYRKTLLRLVSDRLMFRSFSYVCFVSYRIFLRVLVSSHIFVPFLSYLVFVVFFRIVSC